MTVVGVGTWHCGFAVQVCIPSQLNLDAPTVQPTFSTP